MSSLSNFAIPPDPAQKTNDLDWLLYSGATANTGIDALLAPHPDAFERELDDLGIDDSLLSSLVVPNDDLGNQRSCSKPTRARERRVLGLRAR